MAGVSLDFAVTWGDMDALAHVNNLVYLRWFESARVAYFEKLGLAEPMLARKIGPILARQEIDYEKPLTYPDTVRVTTNVSRLGKTSFTMTFRIVRAASGEIVAKGEGVMVLVDYAKGGKLPLSADFMKRVAELEA